MIGNNDVKLDLVHEYATLHLVFSVTLRATPLREINPNLAPQGQFSCAIGAAKPGSITAPGLAGAIAKPNVALL